MPTHPHNNLPRVIPIFPLSGVILLPSAKLPLNIFEPRYLKMTRDALKSDWIIGMVQPRALTQSDRTPDIYHIGCAGKIIAFSETDDGRILITLEGIARFKIRSELTETREYRRTEVDWRPFRKDLHTKEEPVIDRPRFEEVLRQYFAVRKINAQWKEIEQIADTELVTSLAVQCPFTFEEKQALLEAPGIKDRAELILSLLTMAVASDTGTNSIRH